MSSRVEIALDIPDELIVRLEAERRRLNLPMDALIIEVVRTYLSDLEDETPDAEVMDGLKQSVMQALRGEVVPALEVLDALERDDVNA
ncbi:MAG: hypothetical protein MUC99_04505 [Anaerolineae bacterium]|jgi:hypothetical protein|nr:hypothetical protein [Anaerolineae bacterium]